MSNERRWRWIAGATCAVGVIWGGCSGAMASLLAPELVPREPVEERTSWVPPALSAPAAERPALLGPRTGSRTLHSDTVNSDEMDVAFPSAFEHAWTTERTLYLPEAPTFDAAGNLYIVPLLPHEDVWLVSLDKETGGRRFALEGTPVGAGGSPLVLEDPERVGHQVIYAGSYTEVAAVRDDGEVLWRRPIGLPDLGLDACEGSEEELVARLSGAHVYGLSYHPQTDTIVGVTGSGWLFFVDRTTGVVRGRFELAGLPAADKVPSFPELAWARMDELLAPFIDAPCDVPVAKFVVNAVLGGGTRVANYFSIDFVHGRLWVAGTDPIEPERGALYRLEVRDEAGVLTVDGLDEPCLRMRGGSASTPTVRSDGGRVYVADDDPAASGSEPASLIYAVDAESCEIEAEVGTSAQIVASLAVSFDGEVFAVTLDELIRVQDYGSPDPSHPERQSGFGVPVAFDLGAIYRPLAVQRVSPMIPPAIAQNGLAILVGAGYPVGELVDGVLTTALAFIDRETGAIRYAAAGGDESVATTSLAPDGSAYIGQSPLRRAAAAVLTPDQLDGPLTAGVSRWRALRKDLLARDASCAAADRVAHLRAHGAEQGASYIARATQMAAALTSQAHISTGQAVSEGDLSWFLALWVERHLEAAASALNSGDLERAEDQARSACALLD